LMVFTEKQLNHEWLESTRIKTAVRRERRISVSGSACVSELGLAHGGTRCPRLRGAAGLNVEARAPEFRFRITAAGPGTTWVSAGNRESW
jgi:hypothetical protein